MMDASAVCALTQERLAAQIAGFIQELQSLRFDSVGSFYDQGGDGGVCHTLLGSIQHIARTQRLSHAKWIVSSFLCQAPRIGPYFDGCKGPFSTSAEFAIFELTEACNACARTILFFR
eukprot:SAG11_NODE_2277_length_3581_cov_3.122918_2_plen_118_part_00